MSGKTMTQPLLITLDSYLVKRFAWLLNLAYCVPLFPQKPGWRNDLRIANPAVYLWRFSKIGNLCRCTSSKTGGILAFPTPKNDTHAKSVWHVLCKSCLDKTVFFLNEYIVVRCKYFHLSALCTFQSPTRLGLKWIT